MNQDIQLLRVDLLQIEEGSTPIIADSQECIIFIQQFFFIFHILDNISFTVKEGDLLGIIGPNGAGKTTLFQCMLG